jgi:enolase
MEIMKIDSVKAAEILDSRGNPTVKAYIRLQDGTLGTASVPSGASTGIHEAAELRDGGDRYHGKGVLAAVRNIDIEIAEALTGINVENQDSIDAALIKLDGTDNKSRLGANAILAVSLASARAASISAKLPLYKYLNGMVKAKINMPIPLMNIMNGGAHGNWVTDIQEYMVIPSGFGSFNESVRACSEIYAELKDLLKEKKYSVGVGDEGGFAPTFADNIEPFALMAEASKKAGYALGEHISFGIDAAASEFYMNGKYQLKREGKEMSAEELAGFYGRIAEEYGVASVEDPFSEDDWESFSAITAAIGDRVQIVGDDLYATDTKRIMKGAAVKATNAVLIKPNQIGTLSETLDAISAARDGGQSVIISHRSGETEDSFIADLAVAVGAEEIKSGAPARSERTAKYNRLLEIEKELLG